MTNPESIALAATIMATVIFQGKTDEEVALLAAVFSQIGDTLSTLAAAKDSIKKVDTATNSNVVT